MLADIFATPWPFVASTLLVGCGVAFVLSLSGWRRTARLFPARGRPDGVTYRWRTVWFTPLLPYRFVPITLSPVGVYVRAPWTIRLFHPPLFLPWSALESVTTGFRAGPAVYAHFALDPGFMTLVLPATASTLIQQHTGHRVEFLPKRSNHTMEANGGPPHTPLLR